MALKVIATAADALVILGLMRGQVKQKDNSNEYYGHLEMMGYRQAVRHRILIPAFRVRIPVA